jgi:hypothetical protein
MANWLVQPNDGPWCPTCGDAAGRCADCIEAAPYAARAGRGNSLRALGHLLQMSAQVLRHIERDEIMEAAAGLRLIQDLASPEPAAVRHSAEGRAH